MPDHPVPLLSLTLQVLYPIPASLHSWHLLLLRLRSQKVDLFGDPSSDTEGAISVSSGSREEMNSYFRLRNKLICPTPSSHVISGSLDTAIECLVRRYRLRHGPRDDSASTSVAEVDLDFFHRHLTRPKHYRFPVQTGPKKSPSDAQWISRLGIAAQITVLYA